jgi:ppGpp synthetase/RelA/SpoT-type nucleotidyltranferase
MVKPKRAERIIYQLTKQGSASGPESVARDGKSVAQSRRPTTSHVAEFLEHIRPTFMEYYDGLFALANRSQRQLQLEVEDCVAECRAKLKVPHVQVASRTKSLKSILRKWATSANKLEQLPADQLEDSKALEKVFSVPFLPPEQAEFGRALTVMIARGVVTTNKRPGDRLIVLAEEICSHPEYICFGHDDLVGARVVFHNLADLQILRPVLTERMKKCHTSSMHASLEKGAGKKSSLVKRLFREEDYIARPKADGYRAIHLNFWWSRPLDGQEIPLPCELQIRSQAQHLWALLSRELLYEDTEFESPFPNDGRPIELAGLLLVADQMAEAIARQHTRKKA